MITKVFFYMAVLAVLSSNANKGCNKKITVLGVAIEDKDGALVLVEENGKDYKKGMYFIDGLQEWDKKYYGKKVKVSGVLVLEYLKEKVTDSAWEQQLVGTKATLRKARWCLSDVSN